MNLYILGNGFDRAHGLSCTYYDFCVFLKNSKNNDLQEFANQLEEIYGKDILWNDFEKALGNPNLNHICEINKLFDINIFGETFVDKINNAFKSWVFKLDNDKRNKKYYLSRKDLYFSFNYTSTLEIQYSIHNVKHIHGFIGDCLFDSNQKFIIGHGIKNTENKVELVKLTKKDTKGIIELNKKYFDSLKYKSIDFVKVIGFSYSDIDKEYFIKIQEMLPNVKWILGYFSEKDIANAKKYINELNLNAEIKPINELLVEVK